MTEDMKQALIQVADIYHCNQPVQVPDVYIDQLPQLRFSVCMNPPACRYPQRYHLIDGKIDKFVLGDGVSDTLPVHDLKSDRSLFPWCSFSSALIRKRLAICIICSGIPMW